MIIFWLHIGCLALKPTLHAGDQVQSPRSPGSAKSSIGSERFL